MSLTQVNSAGIADGAIVNADLHSSSDIALSKLNTSGTASSSTFLRGDGAWTAVDLTALSASNLTSGTVPDARFPATLPAVSGTQLTNLNASNISSGTIAAARVATLNQNTTGSAATLTTARTIAGVSFDGSANISLNNNAITNGAGYITSADGGNAATLDSIDSGSFLRSDASDTFSGARLTLSHGSNGYPLKIDGTEDSKIVLEGANNPYIRWREGTTDKAYIQWHSNGKLLIWNSEDSRGINLDATLYFYDGTDYRTIWHSSNDGAGSGLDADTLDGVQGASYLRSDTNDTFTGSTLVFDSSTDQKIILEGSNNPYIRFRESSTNKAYIQWNASTGYLEIRNQEDDSSIKLKDAPEFSADGSTYHSIWHAGNDGGGSGLDADTVDGLDPGIFVRTNAGNSINTSTERKLWFAGSNNPYIEFAEGTTNKCYFGWSSSGYVRFVNSEVGSEIRLDGNPLFCASNQPSGTYHKMWHAGNDGAGSGLDADTLDGVQGASFLRSDADDTYTGDLIINGMKFGDSSNTPKNLKLIAQSGGSGDTGISMYDQNGAWCLQLYGTSNGYYGFLDANWANWDIRKAVNGELQIDAGSGLKTVWHQGNDGSGSGLDADSVDGIEASQLTGGVHSSSPYEKFTSSGTWNRPSGCTQIKVTVTGGGGGGGSHNADDAHGGGGAGGTSIKWIDVSSISSVTVTVGAGGGGGAGNQQSSGNGGGASSFGSHCTGSGGGHPTVWGRGGGGGSASGGHLNLQGGGGGSGNIDGQGNEEAGGTGGASFWGGGQSGGTHWGQRHSGGTYGTGGAGSHADTDNDGGDGNAGIVVVEHFY